MRIKNDFGMRQKLDECFASVFNKYSDAKNGGKNRVVKWGMNIEIRILISVVQGTLNSVMHSSQ